jgi:hypothetical protein
MTAFERLFGRTVPRGGCLIFQGSEPFRVGPVGSPRMSTQRAAWLITKGAPPAGMSVVRTCRQTRCVEPTHLALLTASDAAATTGGPQRTFTADQVRAIRRIPPNPPPGTLTKIAQDMGVNVRSVRNLRTPSRRARIWRGVE